jgi:hypothetical protein
VYEPILFEKGSICDKGGGGEEINKYGLAKLVHKPISREHTRYKEKKNCP